MQNYNIKFKIIKRKAISLMELLIVMGIISIIAAISIPAMQSYLPSLNLSSSAKAINTRLRQAQEEAVTTQKRHSLRFNTAVQPTEMSLIRINSDSSETTLDTVKLAKDVTLTIDPTITSNQVIFSADGGPNGSGNITVTLGEASKIINISPAGVIKLLIAEAPAAPTATPTPTATATATPTPIPTTTPTPTPTPTDTPTPTPTPTPTDTSSPTPTPTPTSTDTPEPTPTPTL